jgi:hypothetical protein
VEPVFLQAESGGLPELKRVIVAAGDRIAMEPTLETSLMAIFGDEAPLPKPIEESPIVKPEKPITTDIAELVEEAQQHYDNAQQFLKDGNWTGYGTELDALREVLRRLTELTSVLTE